MRDKYGQDLADRVWNVWRTGRNQIFHYFPHNIKAISFDEAEKITNEILEAMEETYKRLNLKD